MDRRKRTKVWEKRKKISPPPARTTRFDNLNVNNSKYSKGMSMKILQPLPHITRKNCAKIQETILRSPPCRRLRVKFELQTPSTATPKCLRYVSEILIQSFISPRKKCAKFKQHTSTGTLYFREAFQVESPQASRTPSEGFFSKSFWENDNREWQLPCPRAKFRDKMSPTKEDKCSTPGVQISSE